MELFSGLKSRPTKHLPEILAGPHKLIVETHDLGFPSVQFPGQDADVCLQLRHEAFRISTDDG